MTSPEFGNGEYTYVQALDLLKHEFELRDFEAYTDQDNYKYMFLFTYSLLRLMNDEVVTDGRSLMNFTEEDSIHGSELPEGLREMQSYVASPPPFLVRAGHDAVEEIHYFGDYKVGMKADKTLFERPEMLPGWDEFLRSGPHLDEVKEFLRQPGVISDYSPKMHTVKDHVLLEFVSGWSGADGYGLDFWIEEDRLEVSVFGGSESTKGAMRYADKIRQSTSLLCRTTLELAVLFAANSRYTPRSVTQQEVDRFHKVLAGEKELETYFGDSIEDRGTYLGTVIEQMRMDGEFD